LSYAGVDFGFTGASYVAPMGLQSVAECINFYVEAAEDPNSKMPNSLLGCPGLAAILTPAGGQVRGMYVLPGSQGALVVVGATLYLVTVVLQATALSIPTFKAVAVGTLLTQVGPVVMRDNGVLENGLGGYCLMVDGLNCYYYYLAGATHSVSFEAATVVSSNTIAFPGDLPNGLIVSSAATLTDASGAIPAGTKILSVDTVALVAVISPAASIEVASDLMTLSIPAFGMVTDPGFLGANRIAFIEGFLVFNQPNTRTFYSTGPGPYSVLFPGLFFSLKDSSTDNLVTVYEQNRELWLFGERTSEVWYNSGGSNGSFPFSRIPGVGPQVGCAAPYSIARCAAVLAWLGRNEQGQNIVLCTNNYAWDRISTHAVEHAIAGYSVVSDALGFSYEEEGHLFYVLTFPTADVTWCYDFTSKLWHKRLAWDIDTGLYHRHRSNCFMDFADVRMVGDYANGNIYQMSRKFYSDNGAPLRALRRTGPIWDRQNRERLFHSQLQIEVNPGVGP
jgi:hypothetical protein